MTSLKLLYQAKVVTAFFLHQLKNIYPIQRKVETLYGTRPFHPKNISGKRLRGDHVQV